MVLISIYCCNIFPREYVPTVREDRVWEYFGYSAYEPLVFLHNLRFDGLMTVQGKEYSRFTLFNTSSYTIEDGYNSPILVEERDRDRTMYYMREADGRVFVLTYDGMPEDIPGTEADPSLMDEFAVYDWTLSEGDNVRYPLIGNFNETFYDFSVRYLPSFWIDGNECATMYLNMDGMPSGINAILFIEGIGVNRNGSLGNVNLDNISGIVDNSDYPTFQSRLNRVFNADGEVIYQDESAFIPSGIEDVTDDASTASDGRTYDMMGREVKEMQPGGVYIRNGRKFIGK